MILFSRLEYPSQLGDCEKWWGIRKNSTLCQWSGIQRHWNGCLVHSGYYSQSSG